MVEEETHVSKFSSYHGEGKSGPGNINVDQHISPAKSARPPPTSVGPSEPPKLARQASPSSEGRIFASPAAKKLAEDKSVPYHKPNFSSAIFDSSYALRVVVPGLVYAEHGRGNCLIFRSH